MIRAKSILIFLSIVGLWLLAGCGQQGFVRAESASASIEDSQNEEPADGLIPPIPEEPSIEDPRSLGRLNFRVAAVGDSISRAFNSAGFGDDPRYSWSTGENLTSSSGSHYDRLRALAGSIGRRVSFSAVNVAAVGAEVIGTQEPPLSSQALDAKSYRSDYVTVLIGANDLCATRLPLNQFVDVFRGKVEGALRVLSGGSHPAKLVLLASIPNPRTLKSIKKAGSLGEFQCMIRRFVCGNMEDLPAELFDAYWEGANLALKSAAEKVGGPVVFDRFAVASSGYQAEDVSDIDCFHPSEAGQRKIADVLWPLVEPHLEKILRTH